jgi:hypothetical protein
MSFSYLLCGLLFKMFKGQILEFIEDIGDADSLWAAFLTHVTSDAVP